MAMSESTFNSYLAKILSARYGEEVRGSIHDSLQGMYEIVKQNTLDVSSAKQMLNAADTLTKATTAANNAANAANTAATNLNKLKTEASNAATAANTAASKANTATTKANDAASKANTATAAANNAALGAQSATSNANAATSKANTAASKATEAANSVNEAKTAANTAASKATEAANSVNEAKTAATDAASAANEAASKANTATTKANDATSKANTATTNANKARDAANEAASKAETATNRANDAAAIIETLDVKDINTGEIATKRYVEEQIDGIEIGGTNILTDSENPNINLYANAQIEISKNVSVTDWGATDAIRLSGTCGTDELFAFLLNRDGTKEITAFGDRICFSMFVKNDGQNAVKIGRRESTNVYSTTVEPGASGRFYVVKATKDTSVVQFHLLTDVGAPVDVTIWHPKIEYGDRPTGWSPAPEDMAAKDYVKEQIDDIQIGGRNLLLSSADPHIIKNAGTTATITKNVSVTEWNASDAIRINGTAGTNNIAIILSNSPSTKIMPGKFVTSMYIKNDGDKDISFGRYIRYTVHPGDSGYYSIADVSPIESGSNLQIQFITETAGDAFDFTFWHPKLELGNKPTDWTPAPEDINAKIDGIEIGGRNYIINGNFANGMEGWQKQNLASTNTNVCEVVTEDNKNWLHMVGNGIKYTDSAQQYSVMNKTMFIYKIDIYPKKKFIFSAIVKSTKANQHIYVNMAFRKENEENVYNKWFGWNINNETKMISFPLESTASDNHFIRIAISTNVGTSGYAPGWSLEDNDTNDFYITDIKLEYGNKATDYTPVPEYIDHEISRRATITYDYGGRNLKEVFGTAEALHTALTAEDYSHIAVGDYWPITLNGKFRDYGSYTVKSGVKYYSNNNLQTLVSTTEETYEGAYVSETAVSFSLSDTTYYVAIGDCLTYFERTCTNVVVNLEVAGINHYWRYGNRADLTGGKPHIVFVSRDCLPFLMRMRKANTIWESTEINNPWVGSAMFKTLNDETHGVFPLVTKTDVGAYIYNRANKLGMLALLETKAPDGSNATSWGWYDRGKLFLPSVAEVWGYPFWAEMNRDGGLGNQFAIFRDSLRHISKGNGNNASRAGWWLGSSRGGNTTNFANVSSNGTADSSYATKTYAVPVCFIFA